MVSGSDAEALQSRTRYVAFKCQSVATDML